MHVLILNTLNYENKKTFIDSIRSDPRVLVRKCNCSLTWKEEKLIDQKVTVVVWENYLGSLENSRRYIGEFHKEDTMVEVQFMVSNKGGSKFRNKDETIPEYAQRILNELSPLPTLEWEDLDAPSQI